MSEVNDCSCSINSETFISQTPIRPGSSAPTSPACRAPRTAFREWPSVQSSSPRKPLLPLRFPPGRHSLLRQPDGLSLQPYLQSGLTVLRLVEQQLRTRGGNGASGFPDGRFLLPRHVATLLAPAAMLPDWPRFPGRLRASSPSPALLLEPVSGCHPIGFARRRQRPTNTRNDWPRVFKLVLPHAKNPPPHPS